MLCTLLGILLVIYPNTSLTIVCRAVGLIVLITGVGFLISHARGGFFSWFHNLDLILGILFMILGGYILISPLGLLSIVPIVFGVLLIFHGISDFGQALQLWKCEADRWWLPMILAAITVVLGIVIMKNPFGTIDILMRIIGICLIYDGVSDLVIAGKFSGAIRDMKKFGEEVMSEDENTIDGDYKEL